MAHSDEDEQVSQHESGRLENDEEGEEEGAEVQRSGELGDTPVAEPEVDDSFEDEEEVFAPKPFPCTILLTLPDRTAAASSSAPRAPTRVHVCLTRGTMHPPAAPHRNKHGDEEKKEIAAAVAEGGGEMPSRHGSAAPTTSSYVESGAPSAASRMQGCCAAGHTFEVDYATRLAVLRRRHILRRLHGNSDRQRRFLEQEGRAAQRCARAAPSEGADEDEDGAVAAGGGVNAAPGVDAADDPTDPLEGVVWPWTSAQRPPPYWLPSLLTSDAPTFQRVLQVMYGWVITPESHPADRLRLTSSGQLLSGPPREKDGGPAGGHHSEDDDDVDQADPAHHKPDFFLPSNAFGGGDEEEEGDEMEKSKNRSNTTDRGDDTHDPERPSKSLMTDFNDCDENESPPSAQLDFAVASVPDALPRPASIRRLSRPNKAQTRLSTATAPPPVVALPVFPFTAYELFLACDTESGEWHLLDTHPLFVMEACRRLRAAQMEAQELSEKAGGTRVRQNTVPNGEDEDEEEEGEEDDDDGGSGGKNARPSGAFPPQGRTADDGDADELCHVPVYDMATLIPVSPITLAALFSGPALRCCLLQPLRADSNNRNHNNNGDDATQEEGSGPKDAIAGCRVPDHAVLRTFDAAWLAEDVAVALPILATICRARQHVLQQDATRIPYPLTPLWLDPRPLFTLSGFKDATQRATPADVRQWCVRPEDKAFVDDEDADGGAQSQVPSRPVAAVAVSTLLPHKWGDALDHILPAEHYGRVVLSALLAAEVLPTQPLRLSEFTQLDGLRLAVWWWLRLPPTLLLRWGADASAAAAAGEDGGVDEQNEGADMAEEVDGDEGERDGPLDTMRPEEATEVLLRRATVMQQRTEQSQRRRQRAKGALFLFAPLLQRVLVELQRRLDRAHGKDDQGQPLPPSQFALQESVARTYAVERLDSGRSRQDPLVTSTFVGAATSSSSSSAADVNDVPREHTAVRHHRLYQSDIVLMALGLTTTPAPPPPRLIAVDVEDTAVGERNGDADGHTALFEHLLDAKLLRCVRSPIDRARAGTTKLLLLSAADFCTSASRFCLFTRLPTFELLGNSGYCPLPELVQAWSNAATRSVDGPCAQTGRAVRDFAHHLWNEMRWRLDKGQYSAAVVTRMKGQLPELFDCVASHTSTYYAVLARLQSEADAQAEEQRQLAISTTTAASAPRLPHKASALSTQRANRPQRPSRISGPTLQINQQEAVEKTYPAVYATQSVSGTAAAAAAAAAVNIPLSVAHPNKYSAAVMDAKEHVYALWAAFPVSPLTYWTPETLYVLLFGRPGGEGERVHAAVATPSSSSPRHFHAAALQVLLEHGVSTVQPCPLDTLEVPAVEAALDRADVEALKVLLGLGAASLWDLRRDGSATLESWAEALFSPADMQVLHYVEAENAKAARGDPRVQFGGRRFETAITYI